MPFGLQSDIPDRALPDALRSLLVEQTEALEALLHYAHDTMDTLHANGHLSPQEQTTGGNALAQEVSERLTALAYQNTQTQTHMEEFQRLLRQQGNPILAYTVERVKEVLKANFMMAKQQLNAMILGQST